MSVGGETRERGEREDGQRPAAFKNGVSGGK